MIGAFFVALALAVVGLILAFTIAPGAINMAVGCGLAAALVAAFVLFDRRRGAAASACTYPHSRPRWLREPYGAVDRCYGCGLEPEIMKLNAWVLCFWCNELRITVERRTRVPLWAI